MVDENDVWIYIYEKGEVRYTDLINSFVDAGKCSKPVLLKHKTRLEADHKVEKKLSAETNRPVYYVPKVKHPEVQAIIEERQITSEVKHLSPKERADILTGLREKENNKILMTLAAEGSLMIPEISKKTGFSESKVFESIWGEKEDLLMQVKPKITQKMLASLIGRGWVDCDNHYWLPEEQRTCSLSLLGLYLAIKMDPENMDRFVEKWGHLHPFIFKRLGLFEEYGLKEVIKEFLKELNPSHSPEGDKKDMEDIENQLIHFISNLKSQYVLNWLKVLHKDRELRDKVERHYKEDMESFKGWINRYQRCLKIIGALGFSEPDWEEMKWNVSLFQWLP